MNKKVKYVFIAIGILIVGLLIGTFVFEYIKSRPKNDYEDYNKNGHNQVGQTIKTYDEITDELTEVANLLMESNIEGNLSTASISADNAPDCVKQARKDTYYICYNNGVTYYVIYTDIGWLIITEE